MKKIQLSVFILGLGFITTNAMSSFTASKSVLAQQWFQYNGGGEGIANNYTAIEAPEGCDDGEVRCAIFTDEDMANPGHPTSAGVASPLLQENRSSEPQ